MDFQWLNFLPADWVNALYSTLLHSLWIGLLMTLLVGAIILGTKNSSPALKYSLLTGLLGTFSIVMIVVFYQSLNNINLFSAFLNRDVSNSNSTFKYNFVNDIGTVVTTLSTYANQLLLVWFGIILMKAVRLLLGLQGVHHLKHTKIFDAGNFWQHKVDELSQQLYIKQSVQIFQSGIAKIPMVIGHFKPVILMPIGMLNHLSLTEVEAILSHELAHIKRRDYLVNIFQNVLEVLFFFNPAVLWLSRLIKEERENCCDDLAISCTNDKNGYLKALVSCQEFNLNATGFAMSMANGKGQLISRIRRIAFNKKASLGSLEKTMLTMSLLLVLALSVAFTLSEKPKHIVKTTTRKVQTITAHSITETIDEKTRTMQTPKHTSAKTKLSKMEVIYSEDLELGVAGPASKKVDVKNEAIATCAKIDPVKSVEFYAPPVSKTVSTTTSTTTSTVKVDGKVVVHVSYQGKDAREDIKRDMVNDNIIVIGENPSYVLNRNEMLVNGVKQDTNTHQKYKEKYITRADTQYRIGS